MEIIVDNIKYDLRPEDGGAFVIANDYQGDITIPAQIIVDEQPIRVVGIAQEAFYGCDDVTSITLPEGLTTIEDSTFEFMSGLTEIVIPDSVTHIGKCAFCDCDNLKKVVLPFGLKYLSAEMFESCGALEKIILPQSVKTIGDGCFAACVNLKTIVLPEGLEKIEARAFHFCGNIDDLHIPSSVKEIGESAFYSCTSLKRILLPDGLEYVPADCFALCENLIDVVIPKSVKMVEQNAFAFTKYTRTVFLHTNDMIDVLINNIRYTLDSETKTATVERLIDMIPYRDVIMIPEHVNYEGDRYCVTRIGKRAFAFDDEYLDYVYEEKELTNEFASPIMVDIPHTVTMIEDEAFYRCFDLVGVTLHALPNFIGKDVFKDCNALQTILVPKGMKEEFCARNLEAQRDMIVEDLVEIGGLYYHLDRTTMTAKVVSKYPLPVDAKNVYWQDYKGYITIPATILYANETYRVVEIGTNAFAYSDIERIDIPAGVERIGEAAFEECSRLSYVVFPDSVHTVGADAFRFCDNLQMVKLSDALQRLEQYTFSQCNKLRAVVFGKNLRFIGESAFYDCEQLSFVDLPDTVEVIEAEAFRHSGLRGLRIPNQIRELNLNILDGCYELEEITLGENIEHILSQWEKPYYVSIRVPKDKIDDYCQKGLEPLKEEIDIIE